jgi:hypothetical protein
MREAYAIANSDHLVGALIITVAVCAMAEVARPLRFLNVAFGFWLIAAPWLLLAEPRDLEQRHSRAAHHRSQFAARTPKLRALRRMGPVCLLTISRNGFRYPPTGMSEKRSNLAGPSNWLWPAIRYLGVILVGNLISPITPPRSHLNMCAINGTESAQTARCVRIARSPIVGTQRGR